MTLDEAERALFELGGDLDAAIGGWVKASLGVLAPFMEQINERGVSNEVADQALNGALKMARERLVAFAKFDGLPDASARAAGRRMTAVALAMMGAALITAAREISPETIERMEGDAGDEDD